jgi:hypothetical protein
MKTKIRFCFITSLLENYFIVYRSLGLGRTSRLSATASIKFPRFKTLSAWTLKILAAGNLQMTAIVTHEPMVWKRRHLPEFIVLDAVRTPNYRHGHCGFHRVTRFWRGGCRGRILTANC